MDDAAELDRRAEEARFARGFLSVALLVYLALGAWIATRSIATLVGAVPDDAFYYLQIARNVASGLGPTMDGVSFTNGFHPAWLLCLSGLAWIARDPGLLLRAAVVLALTLNLLTAWLIRRTLAPLFGDGWSILAAALWILNPLPLLLAVQTVESSLYILSLAAATLLWSQSRRSSLGGDEPSVVASVALGCAVAAVVMARSEGAAVAVSGALFVVAGRRTGPLRLRSAAAMLAGFLVALAPLVTWSWSSFGTIRQDSAAMKMLWRAQSPHLNFVHGMASFLRTESTSGRESVAGALPWLALAALAVNRACARETLRRRAAPAALAALAVAVVLMGSCDIDLLQATGNGGIAVVWVPLLGALLVSRWWAGQTFVGAAAWCLVAASVLQGVFYGALFTDIQVWYLALPSFAAFLVVISLLGGAVGAEPRTRRFLFRAVAILGGVASLPALLQIAQRDVAEGRYPWQRDVLAALPRIGQMMGPSDRLGALNSGVASYFAPYPVANLDGLVNHRVAVLAQEHRADRFLRDESISLVFDEERSWERAERSMQQPPRRTALERFPMTAREPRFLWRIDWPTARGDLDGTLAPPENVGRGPAGPI